MAWLSRNAGPIAAVLVAAALVVGVFEVIDAVSSSTPSVASGEAAEPAGIASLAGLIKVTVFLGVGTLVARPLRRRLRSDVQSQPS